MIGFAVTERCPSCRMVLDTLAVPPGVIVLHRRQCHSRRCRGAARGPLYFFIQDGQAQPLTREEAERMLEGKRPAIAATI